MNKMRLHTRMLVAAVLLTTVVTLCLDVVGVYIIRSYMTDRFKGRISFLAKYLAVNSEVGVLIRDRAGLNSLAVNLLGEEDVGRVTILDSEGHVLASQHREISGTLKTVETSVRLNKTDDENLLFKTYTNTPFGTLTIPGVDSIGTVRIQYSTRGINRLILVITKQFILVSLALTAFAAVIFYFIVRNIVTDVTELASVSRMVGSGDLELRAEPGTLPETRELAFAFNSMLDSIEKSRKAYERITKEAGSQRYLAELGKFSLMVAHEVKNPLAIIKSSFDFLKKEYDVSSDSTMAEFIDDEIIQLNRLIEDFLMFAKPGNMAFTNVSINTLIRDTVKRYDILYMDRAVRFELSIKGEAFAVRADPNLIIRVLDNIIKNAVEASPDNGTIRIFSYEENDRWFVEIVDQGDGIEPGQESKLFDPFFTTKSKGSGLGLALAYQIVKAHEGILYASNSRDGGAVFTLGIPVG